LTNGVRYRIEDADEVFDRVNEHASAASRMDFEARLDEIANDPYPGDADIFPYKDDDKPNSFTASFGDGLVVYQVMLDHPIIFLWDALLY